MSNSQRSSTYDDFITFILERIPPDDIVGFKLSEEEQERARELLDHYKEGMITAEDFDELQQMRYFDRFLSLLNAKALAKLRG